MRLLAVILALGIVVLQWPLWVGKGSWLQVLQTEREVAKQKADNAKQTARNQALDAEVRDLKTGSDAIEERARNELGMVRQDEVFYQILDSHASGVMPTTPLVPVPAPSVNKPETASVPAAVQPSADAKVTKP